MKQETYRQFDATDLARLVQQKEVTPLELAEAAWAQLEKVNPTLNAVIHNRKENAFREASQTAAGDFAGVPMLLKNISQALKGEPLTSGSRLLKQNIAQQNSCFVDVLQKAGFTFLGHTNTPEFGLKNITEPYAGGPSRNPWDHGYAPGGSSGGSAAAIAAGIVPVAGASDGGGSIRIPASFTGLVGLKPTRGRTPVGPGVGRQWQGASIDFVLSRSVRDSAAMLDDLQTVQDAAAFQTPLFPGKYVEAMQAALGRPLRIGFTAVSPVGTPVSAEAVAAVRKTVNWLEACGHEVEAAENGVDGIALMRNYFLMNSGEMSGLVKELEAALGRSLDANDMEIETWLLNVAGQSVSAAEFTSSLAAWDTAAAQMSAFHQKYDLYLTPATADHAPKVGELTHSKANEQKLQEAMLNASARQQQEIIYDMFLPSLTYTPFTQLANLTGQPAISLPVHLTENGLPLGVQFMAAKGREDLLLAIAWQAEQSDIWQGMQGNPYYA